MTKNGFFSSNISFGNFFEFFSSGDGFRDAAVAGIEYSRSWIWVTLVTIPCINMSLSLSSLQGLRVDGYVGLSHVGAVRGRELKVRETIRFSQ